MTPRAATDEFLFGGSNKGSHQYAEVFDHYFAVGVRQHRGELVVGLPPYVHDSAVQPGELGFRRPVAVRAGYASGELSTHPTALGDRRTQGGGVGDFGDLAARVGDSGEDSHPEIDTCSSALGRCRVQVCLDDAGERDEQPSPAFLECGTSTSSPVGLSRLGPFCANASVASQDVEIAIVVQHGNVGS